MIAQIMDLLTDQEIVIASADPSVMPPRTDSLTLFDEFAIARISLINSYSKDTTIY